MPFMPGSHLMMNTALQGSDPLKKRRSAPSREETRNPTTISESKPNVFKRAWAWLRK